MLKINHVFVEKCLRVVAIQKKIVMLEFLQKNVIKKVMMHLVKLKDKQVENKRNQNIIQSILVYFLSDH